MTIEEKIKILYPEINDQIIKIYKDKAIVTVRNYLNVNYSQEKIENDYEAAVMQLIENAIVFSKGNGVKQMTQGSRSVTYVDNKSFSITDDIEALLPAPFAKFVG